MTTVSQEDYLKTIWDLKQQVQIPRGVRIAQALKVSPPAVTLALRRLSRAGLVTVNSKGQVFLTRKGEKEAENLVFRHQLVEKLLTEVLGVEWYKVHEEAEKLEHAISPEVEKKLSAYFGREGVCPHGYKLRKENSGPVREQELVPLQEVGSGAKVKIIRIWEKERKFLEFLDSLGILPGRKITVLERSFDDTVTLKIKNKKVFVGKTSTTGIWVRKTK